jgi:catechol 2,3-dioxygenase-like lactoylglutathione lyase family enzyme
MADVQAGLGLDIRFSHVAIGVSDMDRSLEFYRDVLGMDVVFDEQLSGVPFAGRAAGGLIGGVCVAAPPSSSSNLPTRQGLPPRCTAA